MNDIRHPADITAASEYSNQQFDWAVAPDDRLGPKPPGRRRKIVRRMTLLLGFAALGYSVYVDPARLTRAWTLTTETLGPALQQAFDRTATAGTLPAQARTNDSPPGSAKDPVKDTGLPPPERLADVPPSDQKSTAAAAAEATPPGSPRPSSGTAETSSTPLVRPVIEPPQRATAVDQPYAAPIPAPLDRYGARARSVGLHPDLSRALLADLSNADFHNADVAIRKALSQASDAAVVKWPRQREDGLALFEVRFVSGAAPGCRRYVVTVEKHKWLTTAPPLETCTTIKRAGGPHARQKA